ncbi:MAG TPA: phosphatidylinositol mannoside acyltransferase [Acidimicrobiales bacterium]|nr:phosphatidylinositol mannoside acyltransferase [Acidimicrobiales bacterium]
MNKDRAVFRLYTTLGRALGALPEPLALWAAARVGDVMFVVRRQHREMITRNLRRVLGGGTDDAVLDHWARRAFGAYARYWVEGARLGSTPMSEVLQRIVADGFEHLVDAMAEGNGVVLALPHVGSWEYGGAFLAGKGYPMTAVAERIEPPELFDYFVEQRAAMGLTIVPLDADSGSAMIKSLRDGKLVGLLCDRDLLENGIEVEFFGETTTMPAGPATLALRTGARLLTSAVYSGPGRDHHAVVQPPIDTCRTGSFRTDVQRITQEIATRFEGLIRQAPEQWHVFQPLWPVDRTPPAP